MITILCERDEKTDLWISPEDQFSYWPTKAWHRFSTSSWVHNLQTWPGASKFFRVFNANTPIKKGWYLIFANTVDSFVNNEGFSAVAPNGSDNINHRINVLIVFVHEGLHEHDLALYQKNLSILLDRIKITRSKSVHILIATPLDFEDKLKDPRVVWHYYPWSAGIALEEFKTKMPYNITQSSFDPNRPFHYMMLSARSVPRRDLVLKMLEHRNLLTHGQVTRPKKNGSWQEINLTDFRHNIPPSPFASWLLSSPDVPNYEFIDCHNELTGIKRHWSGLKILYDKSQWEIVNETQGSDTKNPYLSLNIFRTILMGLPFVVNGSPGTLSLLHDMGFKTFQDVVDESYDKISDPIQRAQVMVDQVHRICTQDLSMHTDTITDIVRHNQTLAINQLHLQAIHDLLNNA